MLTFIKSLPWGNIWIYELTESLSSHYIAGGDWVIMHQSNMLNAAQLVSPELGFRHKGSILLLYSLQLYYTADN